MNIPPSPLTVGMATWAFMFAACYGFFPDKKVPFGPLQPYVGIGFADLYVRFDKFTTGTASLALVTDAG